MKYVSNLASVGATAVIGIPAGLGNSGISAAVL